MTCKHFKTKFNRFLQRHSRQKHSKAVNKADIKARQDPKLTQKQISRTTRPKANSKADLTRRQDFKADSKADKSKSSTQSWLADKDSRFDKTQRQIPKMTRPKAGSDKTQKQKRLTRFQIWLAKADSKDDKLARRQDSKVKQKQILRTTRLKAGSLTRLKGKADKTQSWLQS